MLNKTIKGDHITITSGRGCVTGEFSIYNFKMSANGDIQMPSVSFSPDIINRIRNLVLKTIKQNGLTFSEMCNVDDSKRKPVTNNRNDKQQKTTTGASIYTNDTTDDKKKIAELESKVSTLEDKLSAVQKELTEIKEMLLKGNISFVNSTTLQNTKDTKDTKEEEEDEQIDENFDWSSMLDK